LKATVWEAEKSVKNTAEPRKKKSVQQWTDSMDVGAWRRRTAARGY